MKTTLALVACVAFIGLTIGFRNAADAEAPATSTPGPESNSNSPPDDTVQNSDDTPGAESAKMGKAEGTQTGGANQGTSEKDTQKMEQPPRQNSTTGK
jgi:hypothetical protein